MTRGAFDHWQPITDDDDTIRAALEEASIPALICTLVHLTGDVTPIREISLETGFMADPNGGVPAATQSEIRERAFDALTALRDGRASLPPAPDDDTVREMMDFLVGGELGEDYLEFLQSELSLRGEDPYGQPMIDEVPAEDRAGFEVIVIGSGMSGILAAIRLKEAGIPFTVLEKNADVGGTWYENRYPGCRVDSPNHTYSYSFEPKDWPQHFSPQAVLLDYFDTIATRYGIREHICFNTEVQRAAFDEATGRWQITATRDGETVRHDANAVIAAVGQLNRPRFPDVSGVGSFDGPEFHSARWEYEHDLTGKKVAVVGTGASAFQFVPEIAKEAGSIAIFQRTPPWIVPNPDYHASIPEGKHWLLNHVPWYAKWFRFLMFWRTSEGLLPFVKKDPSWNEAGSVSAENDMLRQMLTENIKAQLGDDPELLEKCIPAYPPAGKRMLIDAGGWLETLKQDHVQVLTDSIAEINPGGIRTEDGVQHDFDVVIYGTGFHASKILWPIDFIGRDGKSLQAHWDGDPRAYLGITTPGFPNLFMMYGPNTNIVVNGSIVFFSECEIRYILGCIAMVLEGGKKAIDCRQSVHDAFNERIDEGNMNMAWGAPGVRSWYKNQKGRVTQNWPFSLRDFWAQTRAPDPADFELID